MFISQSILPIGARLKSKSVLDWILDWILEPVLDWILEPVSDCVLGSHQERLEIRGFYAKSLTPI